MLCCAGLDFSRPDLRNDRPLRLPDVPGAALPPGDVVPGRDGGAARALRPEHLRRGPGAPPGELRGDPGAPGASHPLLGAAGRPAHRVRRPPVPRALRVPGRAERPPRLAGARGGAQGPPRVGPDEPPGRRRRGPVLRPLPHALGPPLRPVPAPGTDAHARRAGAVPLRDRPGAAAPGGRRPQRRGGRGRPGPERGRAGTADAGAAVPPAAAAAEARGVAGEARGECGAASRRAARRNATLGVPRASLCTQD